MRTAFQNLLVFALVAGCSGAASNDDAATGDDAPLVAGGRVQGVVTYTPSTQTTAESRYVPGADAAVALWKSKVTAADGWLATPATLALRLIPGGLVATPDLAPLSPLLALRARGDDDAAVPRETLRASLLLETVVDRKIDPTQTIGLLILNHGTPTETRYALPPSELAFFEQADGSTIVRFPTRDTDLSFAVAAATKGGIPAGFMRYPSVPPDSADLAGTSAGVDDLPAEIKLGWTPGEGTRKGYLLSVAYDGAAPPVGCADGTALAAADVSSERKTFPVKVSTDRTVARGLTDGHAVQLRLCSLNDRTPPDASPGITLVFQLPARARATLSGVPAPQSNAATLGVSVAGDGVTHYKYALLPGSDPAACVDAVYTDWTPASEVVSDPVTDGAKILCVLGKSAETNVQRVATTHAWTVDATPPGAFTLTPVPTPSATTAPLLSWTAASGAVAYDLEIGTDAACTATVQTASTLTRSRRAATLADGTYYACVTAVDAAGNRTPAANTGLAFVVDVQPPQFAALPLENEAADGYVNAADHAVASALAGSLAATGHTSAAYALATVATTCDGALTYGAMPLANAAGLVADASYKVCVELSDAAGNKGYGESPDVVHKVASPVFTSLALAGDVANGYLNLSEHSGTSPLASAVVGALYDTATYAVVTSATACSGATYGAMPRSNAAAISAVTTYKVCVRLADAAGNPPVQGASAPFVYDPTPPAFGALSLANAAADGYLNAAEHAGSSALASSPSGTGYDAAAYALVPAATPCNHLVTYGAMPQADAGAFGADGSYKVCARLTDDAGNPPAYGASAALALDVAAPALLAVDALSANGAYLVADTLQLTLTYDEAVVVGGSGNPTLLLETGTTTPSRRT